jgi:hypothetical protein
MFSSTGSEKAFVALGSVVLPLTVLVGWLLAWSGLGEMPEPIQVRDAIVYFLINFGVAYGVWRVPNEGYYTEADVQKAVESMMAEVDEGITENPVA